jgi:hypothetical protein
MNKPDAHHILDLARSGAPLPREVITAALYVTGDAQMPGWRDWLDAEDFVAALLGQTADVKKPPNRKARGQHTQETQ